MPRSFLVKKHLTNKKPNYGVLDSKKHEVIHIESSSSKLKILHPHETLFPAPFLGNSALSPTLRMNPISSGICVPPQHPSLPMDGTFLGITYPLPVTSSPLRDMRPALPVLECTKPRLFQLSQRDLQDNVPVSPLGLSTTGNSQKCSDECFDCQKAFLTLSSLANQRQIHCKWQCQKYFSCKYCDKEYVSLGALKMHIRTHTLPCVCKLCGKAFSRPWLLQGHIRTHTAKVIWLPAFFKISYFVFCIRTVIKVWNDMRVKSHSPAPTAVVHLLIAQTFGHIYKPTLRSRNTSAEAALKPSPEYHS